jgi:MFS family permease
LTTVGANPSAGRFRSALRIRDFRLLAIVTVVDGIGSWATTAALLAYVFDRTGTTTSIAIVSAARWVPGLVLGSYGGVIADRYERVKVLVASDVVAFGGMVVMAVVVAGDGPLWAIYALIAVEATAMTANRPASAALTPEIVPERDLTAANGLFSMLEGVVVVVGPAIGALLAAGDRVTVAIIANAASFLVAATLASRLRVRSHGDAAEVEDGTLTAVVEGLRALRAQRTAVVLLGCMAVANTIYGAASVLFVPISVQMGTGPEGYGYLLAGMALGTGLSAAFADRLSASGRLAPVILAGLVALAAPFAILPSVEVPVLAFALMVVAGGGFILVGILAETALQRDIPRGVLGRVMSLADVVCLVAVLVAGVVAAALEETWGLHQALYVVGFGFPCLAFFGVRSLLRSDRANLAAHQALAPRVALLEQLDLLAAANRAVLEGLARAVHVVEVPGPTEVVREGDPAVAMWVLVDGEATVTSHGQPIRALGPGSYFGEIGILRGFPRTATVRTTGPAVLWRIAGEDFRLAIEAGAASASLVRTTVSRLARTDPRLAAPPDAPVSGLG